MRRFKYIIAIIFFALIFSGAIAQSTASKPPKTSSGKKAVPAKEGKEINVSLKNNAEADVSIFAGKKEDLKKPAVKTFGGLSKNTLYIRENDVVCIMKDKKPVSCVDAKPGTTSVEVNSSGNVITKK